ncbi:MAG: MBL fold metallo-hydrolase [Fibrobacter sp.]|nr:MBL fold metallo-hydrolase [Fibrobacter sp.]
MKVQVLIDNIAGMCCSRKLFGEWGLSVYAEYEGHKVLLDTGASHLFSKNANVMGIDLSQVDIGVLSHAHYDHANGMAKFFALNKTAPFYLRKGAGENCYHTGKLLGRFTYHYYIGIHKGWLERFAVRIRFVEGIAEIAPGITLVPHSTAGLERIGEMAHLSVKENGKYRYDDFAHEQSLVFDTPQGLFVMNSCSHAGADNIVKEIEAAFPGKKIYALLGGFHLFRYPDERVRAFAERLRDLDVQKIYTGHCTGDRAYGILRDVLGERAEQMHTGMTIEI